MGRQRRRQSEGTQQTRVRAWAGSVKGQVHDKSRTREPFGERCGQMSDTWFVEKDLRGQNGFGLFMGETQIVRVSFYEQWRCDVERARCSTRAQDPLQPVEATHKENNK